MTRRTPIADIPAEALDACACPHDPDCPFHRDVREYLDGTKHSAPEGNARALVAGQLRVILRLNRLLRAALRAMLGARTAVEWAEAREGARAALEAKR